MIEAPSQLFPFGRTLSAEARGRCSWSSVAHALPPSAASAGRSARSPIRRASNVDTPLRSQAGAGRLQRSASAFSGVRT